MPCQPTYEQCAKRMIQYTYVCMIYIYVCAVHRCGWLNKKEKTKNWYFICTTFGQNSKLIKLCARSAYTIFKIPFNTRFNIEYSVSSIVEFEFTLYRYCGTHSTLHTIVWLGVLFLRVRSWQVLCLQINTTSCCFATCSAVWPVDGTYPAWGRKFYLVSRKWINGHVRVFELNTMTEIYGVGFSFLFFGGGERWEGGLA